MTVEHVSCYRYASTVYSSYNEVRLTPLTTPWQLVLDSRVLVEPRAPILGYSDYWGSTVHAFDIHEPHAEMTITGRSVVETGRAAPPSGPEPSWGDLESPGFRDDYSEFLAATTYVPDDEDLEAVVAQLRREATPAAAAAAAVEWVRSQLSYVSGTTGVHTSAIEAWRGGEGVCQDFAHLTLAALRALGIPGRYCSGYVHPEELPPLGQQTAGESHAWVEQWCGDWVPVDPTAGIPVDERYVLVARGRDYSDVTPVKGIFHGGPAAGLDVTVILSRQS
jgi:transglutaminase-like putative cysteine protease